MKTVYRVNMTDKSITTEPVKESHRLLGGRSLTTRVMTEEVNPRCDPLGPENKLILALGLFAGTNIPTAHRLSVGGKSPLTGGIKESNVGGTVATFLARHGIKMIIIEGLPKDDQWHILKIGKDGKAALIPADNLQGLNTYDLTGKLYDQYGMDISILSIGSAGERLYEIASLQSIDFSTKHPSRAAGRGGLGALAGSKKIKAIVIEKADAKFGITYTDKELYKETVKKMTKLILESQGTGMLNGVGTHGTIAITAPMGVMPVKNFSGKSWPEEKLDRYGVPGFVGTMERTGGKRGLPCQVGCVIQCSNIWNNEKGEYVTSGLEYETTILVGPNCDIDDLNYAAEVDRLCDDIGIDTIEAGNLIAVCMDGGKIPWGDSKAAMDLLLEIKNGTEFGNIMGQGVTATAKAVGAKRIPVVKNQSLPAYDPRNFKGMGVTYATTPQGADHTAGHTLGAQLDHKAKDHQVKTSKEMQIMTCAADSMLCTFSLSGALPDPTILPNFMKAIFGGEWDLQKIIGTIGAGTLMAEQTWNTKAGLMAEDDKLPDFMYEETADRSYGNFDITPEEMQAVKVWQ